MSCCEKEFVLKEYENVPFDRPVVFLIKKFENKYYSEYKGFNIFVEGNTVDEVENKILDRMKKICNIIREKNKNLGKEEFRIKKYYEYYHLIHSKIEKQ